MKIYLDIDGTLIKHEGFDTLPALYLKEFLEYVTNKHDVYWLTTHCNGDASTVLDYMSKYVDSNILELLSKIKPTSWQTVKSEAINMKEDFLWFDDVLSYTDEKTLIAHGKQKAFVQVDLKTNPSILATFIK